MVALADRVRVATSTIGTGTITLGAAYSNAYCTFAEGGITDGQTVSYLIIDGTDFELGTGVYTLSGTTLTRATVLLSKISGTAGTTKINLSGQADVSIPALKEHFIYDGNSNTTAVVGVGSIELAHATANTLTASGGHMTIEGATVWDSGNDGSGSGLDADLLDGKNTGTSGNTVPLLDGTNTWSGTQTFSLGPVINASNPFLQLTDTDTGADCYLGANFSTGALGYWADYGNEVASSRHVWYIDSASTEAMELTTTALTPSTNDGKALGTSSVGWADVFFATGGTIHFANTDWVATHTTGILTVGTGDLRVTTAGTNTASVVTVGGAQTLTSKTLTSPTIGTSPTAAGATWTDLGTVTTADINGGTVDGAVIGGSSAAAITGTTIQANTGFVPDANDGAYLGTTTLSFSDLFLASGGVINWANGEATLTETDANTMTWGGITTYDLSTSCAVKLGTIELGHATDTTLSRLSAGRVGVEGVAINNYTYAATPPTTPAPQVGDKWTDSDDLTEYTYIYDGDSYQWVNLGAGVSGNLPLKGYLFGLTMSNGTDATNDIDIAVGECTDYSGTQIMRLTSGITKQLDAAWAAGTNAGGLDTGAIANTTYHVYIIKNTTTDAVDAIYSTSASSPTMPSGYTLYRRIGSIIRVSAAILAFTQNGDEFLITAAPVLDVNATNPGTSAVTRTLTVPSGIKVGVFGSVRLIDTSATGELYAYISSLDTTDVAASAAIQVNGLNVSTQTRFAAPYGPIRTNTSSQVRSRLGQSSASISINMYTMGWIDTRGRLA